MIARNALVLSLVACGGNASLGVDARPLDAPPDALATSSGDPPPTAVGIEVTVLGTAAPDVPVYFQNPDSAVVLATKTDGRGIAWAMLDTGGYVTAIEPANATGATPITTYAGVKAGDRLRLALQQPAIAPQVTVTLTVPAPTMATPANYEIHDSCGEMVNLASTVGQVTFGNCGNGTIDLVVIPLDADGARSFGALFASGVPIVDGGTASVTGTYGSFVALPLTYRNIPAQVAWLDTYRALVTQRGRVYDASIGDQVTGATLSDSVLLPAVPSDTLVFTATDEMPIASELGEQLVFDWRPISTPYDLDVTAGRLPPFTATPTYDPTTQTIAWSEGTGTVPANFVRVTLHASRDDIPSGKSWTWRIAAPKSTTSVVLPKLPNEGFDFNPTGTDTTAVDGLSTAALVGGYDAIRAHAFDDLLATAKTATGVMVVQTQFAPPL